MRQRNIQFLKCKVKIGCFRQGDSFFFFFKLIIFRLFHRVKFGLKAEKKKYPPEKFFLNVTSNPPVSFFWELNSQQ